MVLPYDDAIEAVADRAKKLAPEKGGAPSCNSFTGDTEVVMADGSTKPISEVEAGEEVLATDETTGETEAREVVTTIEGTGDRTLVEIGVDTDGDGKVDDTITATDEHPIRVADLATVPIEDAFGGNLSETDIAETVDPAAATDGSGSGSGGPPPVT